MKIMHESAASSGSHKIRLALMATTLFTTIIAFQPRMALAIGSQVTPAGEQVVSGNVTFDRSAAGRLDIDQNTKRAIINWDSFDIGKNATAEFHQPGSSSLTVNRVTGPGNDPTQILGTLKANGNLMVLDRNGILFGKNSVVDVGGIIASTGDVDDSSITGGDTKFIFDDFGNAALGLRGEITVRNAGLAAFVAPVVRNTGTITARLGRVELAAGGAIATVDLYGDDLIQLAPAGDVQQALIANAGRIHAEGGTIGISAQFAKSLVDSAINLSGVTDVSSVTRNGGKIVLRGISVSLPSSGRMNASSSQKRGGDISMIVGKADIKGHITTDGKTRAGNILIGRGEGTKIGQSARLTANSENSRGGNMDIGAEAGALHIDGRLTSSGATGGGLIDFNNGDDPVLISKGARILSEARSNGFGGDIKVSSAEGTHVIDGHLTTRGKKGGGNIEVNSRSGIEIQDDGLLETRATASGSGRGGDILLRISEGQINHAGRAISIGANRGGNITLSNDGTLETFAGSSLISNSFGSGRGGNVSFQGFRIDAGGLINVDGKTHGNGGLVELLGDQSGVTLSGDITARGGSASGNGGAVFFSSPNTILPGGSVDVSAPNGNAGTFTH